MGREQGVLHTSPDAAVMAVTGFTFVFSAKGWTIRFARRANGTTAKPIHWIPVAILARNRIRRVGNGRVSEE